MNSPAVSILLPVFRGMPFLKEAIDSVLSQEMSAFELIVGDDGSDDGSLAFLESQVDPRIRLAPPGQRLGLFGNLNRLIPLATAPWVRIFCQDDVLIPSALAEEKTFRERYPLLGMFFCKADTLSVDGQVIPFEAKRDLPNVLEPELAIQHFFYHGCIPGNLSTVTVAKSVLEGLGGFDSRMKVSGDYALWSRIAEKEKVGVLSKALVRLRTHPQRLSSAPGSVEAFVRENAVVRQRLMEFLPSSVHKSARHFELRRHRVLDWHCGLRALFRGQFRRARHLWATFSLVEWTKVAFYWLTTGNNRWVRPQAPWVLPPGYSAQLAKDSAEDRAAS